MVTVGLLTRFLGSGSSGISSGIVCLRLLRRLNSPTVSLQLTPRCLSVLGNLNGGKCKSTTTPAITTPGTWPASTILSPLLLAKYRSYARLSTKSTVQSSSTASKTETKSSSTATVTSPSSSSTELFGEAANMGLFAKFKHMYKQYWYVLIPVHVLTSIGWFGGFYYLSKSGVDVPALLQYLHLSETIIEKVQGSDMGHYAIAYLCYKVATPIRYAVTLGGTTVSIKYLVQWGHIKPMPTKNQLIKMYEDTKATRANAKSHNKDEHHK
ncbi:uncharacterized protein C18orf19 homolog A [Drosophila nasuta]|uniref:uncharacterized protein C18orf19 homolog A n=1 Tax=Drosophila nasuta TaxID=42062 RepID=UPI00295EB211|nr:uncharacterized protein C18orf19 homolog A [Drosophila nasuta]